MLELDSGLSAEAAIFAQQFTGGVMRNELFLHYQPQVCLRSGRIVGAESLVRWNRHGTTVYPDDFLGMVESCGMMDDLFYSVLMQVAQQHTRWQHHNLPLAINLCADQLTIRLLQNIQRLLAPMNVLYDHIIIEITETIRAHDLGECSEVVKQLREWGFKIYIDDFGTGHSNLEYLRKLPVHGIKLARSFITNIHRDRDLVIALSICNLARRLGVITIAEGVETRQHLELLSMLACDAYQGFYFSRPKTAAQFELDFLN